jgi:uncharacterized protein YjaZ
MTIKLTILDASQRLSSLRERIEGAYAHGVKRVQSLLPIDKVDIVVQAGERVIPELGMTGYSHDAHTVFLTINPSSENLLSNFEGEFLAMLGHELHHCMRYRGPGYGNTLRESLVSEGLACVFETELRSGTPPFYCTNVSTELLGPLMNQMAGELDLSPYDHSGWFFGSVERGIPRYAGYCVGYAAVARYVKDTGKSAAELWGLRSDAIAQLA